jgi:hypothetical protein
MRCALKTLIVKHIRYFIIMTTLNINGSSAIASVSFGENNAVGVKFTSNDTEYGFVAKDQTMVREGLETAIANGQSVGKLIAEYRTQGQLEAV